MNSFGRIFKISIFGESHGTLVGVCIDGCRHGIELCENDFSYDIQRRKSGKQGTSLRIEPDMPEIVSGVFNRFTTGAPITILFKNKNVQSEDYLQHKTKPRPGHADFVAAKKFDGFNDYRGGGHFSGRLTLPLVAAGVVAKKNIPDIIINAKIIEAGGETDINTIIEAAINDGDSAGGIIECVAKNIPIGLGEPFFDSIESQIAHLAFSIPAVKGIEFGAGFAAAKMRGSEHNDILTDESGKTATNNSGGVVGGIANGNDLTFRIVVKPTSSIPKNQKTLDFKNKKISDLKIHGRHDACIALRIPVIVEAITAIALADFILLKK
ncbi:MAG: chorismate synthase [Prevotellaceae bacterium]|jgi:chorismate synthase|nr:chorismate synthase [Prevotellaceae bacterium]